MTVHHRQKAIIQTKYVQDLIELVNYGIEFGIRHKHGLLSTKLLTIAAYRTNQIMNENKENRVRTLFP